MVIHHPRPVPNAPWALEEYYTDAEREMFRRWEATLPEVPDRRWWQFWRPNPAKMLATSWQLYEDSITPPSLSRSHA